MGGSRDNAKDHKQRKQRQKVNITVGEFRMARLYSEFQPHSIFGMGKAVGLMRLFGQARYYRDPWRAFA